MPDADTTAADLALIAKFDRVGDRHIIGAQRVIARLGDEIWLSFEKEPITPAVKICVVLVEDEDPKAPAGIGIEGKTDHAVVTLKNFRNTLGMAVAKPIPFGSLSAGHQVFFEAAVWKIGDVRVVEVQITCGGAK